MSTVSENAKKYELMVIVDPDIGEKAVKEHFDELRKNIAALHGEVFYEDAWGLRDLAYKIKKKDRGYYAVLDFMLDPENIRELDRKLRLDTPVLRHMITVLSAYYKPQSYADLEKLEEEEALSGEKQLPSIKTGKVKIEQKQTGYVKADVTPPPSVEVAKAAENVPSAETSKEKEGEHTKKTANARAPSKEEDLKKIDAQLDEIINNPDIGL